MSAGIGPPDQDPASPPGSVEDEEASFMRPMHEALQAEFARLGQQLRKDVCRELRLAVTELLPGGVVRPPGGEGSLRLPGEGGGARPPVEAQAALTATARSALAAAAAKPKLAAAPEECHEWMRRHPRGYLAKEYIESFPDEAPVRRLTPTSSLSRSPVSRRPTRTPTGSKEPTANGDTLNATITSFAFTEAANESGLDATIKSCVSGTSQATINSAPALRYAASPEAPSDGMTPVMLLEAELSQQASPPPTPGAGNGDSREEEDAGLVSRPAPARKAGTSQTQAAMERCKAVSSLAPHRALGLLPSRTQAYYDQPQERRYLVKLIRAIVRSPWFERVALFMNFVSAAFVGFQTDHMAKSSLENSELLLFRVTDIIFLVFFSVEAALRLFVYRDRFFWMTGWLWNVFDLSLVVVQLTEELIVRTTVEGKDLWSSWLLRMVRVLRTIKLFRVMGHIDEFRLLLTCILHSCKSFFWALALLLLMNYVMATYLVQVISSSRHSGDLSAAGWKTLQEWYGSLDTAVFSLFLGLTGGVDWNDIVGPIKVHISPWAASLFIAFMLFGILALMNVVTGTFVQNAIERADEVKALHKVQQARRLFKSLDVDSSGFIGFAELNEQLDNPQVQRYFRTIDVDLSEARYLFDMLDMNDSGTIDFEEFLSGCIRLQGPAKSLDLIMVSREMRCAFQRQSAQLELLGDHLRAICAALPTLMRDDGYYATGQSTIRRDESV